MAQGAPSRVFNWMVSPLTGVVLHDHNCGMKCYRREVLEEVGLYGELHRFVPVLAAARGFRVGELVIQHRPREFGHSKYGVTRFVKGFLDLLTVKFLTGFGQRPHHLLGTVGLVSFFLGLVFLLYLAGGWIASRLIPSVEDVVLHERPALYYSLALFFLGGQLMSIGFVSELITAYHGRELNTYSIAEQIGQGEPPSPVDPSSDGTAPRRGIHDDSGIEPGGGTAPMGRLLDLDRAGGGQYDGPHPGGQFGRSDCASRSTSSGVAASSGSSNGPFLVPTIGVAGPPCVPWSNTIPMRSTQSSRNRTGTRSTWSSTPTVAT